jgi:H+-translocating NAD(P) transhydrogenase subunit beta
VIGLWLAYKTQMASMPQLVALFNGFGGGASLLGGYGGHCVHARWSEVSLLDGRVYLFFAAAVSIVIGAVTFSGSVLAFAKLQGISRQPLNFKGLQLVQRLAFRGDCFCVRGGTHHFSGKAFHGSSH